MYLVIFKGFKLQLGNDGRFCDPPPGRYFPKLESGWPGHLLHSRKTGCEILSRAVAICKMAEAC